MAVSYTHLDVYKRQILIVLIKMDASIVDKDLIERINKEKKKLLRFYIIAILSISVLVLILISLTLWKRKI